MTRECAVDFSKIKKYIDEYKISGNLEIPEYVSDLKVMHKCYFGAITWNAELLNNKISFLRIYENCNEEIVYRLAEVVSDLGSSLFNWSSGNYKAAKIMLRVAVENFIRAVSAIEDKTQLIEKNVYKLFDKASIQSNLNSNITIKTCYESLHADYKLLCEDAHTATIQNMQHLTSLADLPSFGKEKSQSTSKIYVRVTKNISSIFCILFNGFYHGMHHRNKENILNSLDRYIKPIVTAPRS